MTKAYPFKRQALFLVLMFFLCVVPALAADLLTDPVKINVSTPGTLSKSISDSKKNLITNLVLSGELDVHDIQFIREMAGCYDMYGNRTEGHLLKLDLSDVTFKSIAGSSPDQNEQIYAYYKMEGTDAVYKTQVYIRDERQLACAAFLDLPNIREVVLPKDLLYIANEAFKGCVSLDPVTIPSSVIGIAGSAFADCRNFGYFTLPSGLEEISAELFSGCTGLKRVNIPSSVTSIGSSAFSGCTSLSSITLPSGVTSIGSSAFYGCTALTSFTFPAKLEEIGSSAFKRCYNLTSLNLPSGLTEIGYDAFSGCSGVTKLSLPSTLKTIKSSAFYGCYQLQSLTLPASLTDIGGDAFGRCTGLQSIIAKMQNPPICSNDPFTGIDKEECKLYVPKGAYSAYFVANYWGDFAHIDETGIIDHLTVNVDVPGTLADKIGDEQKEWVKSLTVTGTLNDDDIAYIRNMAGFTDGDFCGILEDIDLKNAKFEGSLNFGSCYKLKSVKLPDGLTTIGSQAFYCCSNLVSVDMPSSVDCIESESFYKCGSLESIDISNVQRIEDKAFMGCESLKEVNLLNKVYTGWGAFSQCNSLTTVKIPYGASICESFCDNRSLPYVFRAL